MKRKIKAATDLQMKALELALAQIQLGPPPQVSADDSIVIATLLESDRLLI